MGKHESHFHRVMADPVELRFAPAGRGRATLVDVAAFNSLTASSSGQGNGEADGEHGSRHLCTAPVPETP